MSLFDAAKTVNTTKPVKAKKNDRPEYTIAGLEQLANIDAVIGALTAMRDTVERTVKDQMHNQFVVDGEKLGKRPQNFRGLEGAASASCEIRKRNSRSPLSPEEVELCKQNNISTDRNVTTVECFIINPAYGTDAALLERVSKALEKVKDLPADFIQHQAEVATTIVPDKALDEIFAKRVADDMLPVVATMAVKPALDEGFDVKAAFAKLQELLVD